MLTSGTYSGIKSVQRGTVNIANGASSGTAAVSAVNTAKCQLAFLGQSGPGGVIDMGYIYLLSSTSVGASRPGTTNSSNLQFELTEWY